MHEVDRWWWPLACTFTALFIWLTWPGFATAENLPPDLLVKTVVSDVLDTIKNTKVDNKGSREKALVLAKEKILPHIDFERMTKLAVGKGWRNANAQQRQSLVAQFSTLVTRTYSSAIDAYQGQEALVDPLKLTPADDDVTVHSRFAKANAPPVEVDYAMWKGPNGWKVYDIIVESVSLVTTYRSQFNQEVMRSGVDGLIQVLAEKNHAARDGR